MSLFSKEELKELLDLRQEMKAAEAPAVPAPAVKTAEEIRAELKAELKAEAEKAAADAKAAAEAEAAKAPVAPEVGPEDPNVKRWGGGATVLPSRPTVSEDAERWTAAEKRYGKGMKLGRFLQAQAYAQTVIKDHRPEGVVRALHELKDKSFADAVEKELSSQTPSAGGYLVPESLSNEIIELLYDTTPVFKLGISEVQMPFGNLNFARLASGSTAAYTGENTAPNATEPSFGELQLNSKKLIAIVGISNDLIKSSSMSAVSIIRNDAVKAMGVKQSYAIVQGNPAAGSNMPRGIKYDPDIISGALTVGALVTSDTPAAFIQKLYQNKVDFAGRKLGWLFNSTIWQQFYNLKTTTGAYHFRSEMDMGRLMNFPFEVDTQIANGASGHNVTDIFFGDWAEVLLARQGNMGIDFSTEAAYNNASGTVVAAYSKDQTVMRVIDLHDTGVRQPSAMVMSNDVWTV